jgi:hypothetical protein
MISALSAIPVRKVYLLASIPNRGRDTGTLFPWTLSFAPQITPLDFIDKLLFQPNLVADLNDPQSEIHRYFDQWGVLGSSEYWQGHPRIPSTLLDSIKERQEALKDVISTLPTVGTPDRKVFFKEFDRPYPLTYQSMIYRLPLTRKGKK